MLGKKVGKQKDTKKGEYRHTRKDIEIKNE